MSNKYLIASDFDSTICLWNEGGIIDPRDRDAISRFGKAGHKFVVVTGRTFKNAGWGFTDTNFRDFDLYFCLSGALCINPDDSVIYDRANDAAPIGDIINYFKETNARYLAYDIGQRSGFIDIGGDPAFPPTVTVEEALQFKTFTSFNAGYRDRETAKLRADEIRKRFAGILNPLQNDIAIDMPGAGIDKSMAAEFAAEYFGINRDNVYTVGDNYNDIDMVGAFHGRAMEWGPPELLEVAEKPVHRIYELIDSLLSE